MDRHGVRQAWERLHKAQKAYSAITDAENFGQVESAWTDFLLAASAVYSKLERGAKGTSSAPWFGKKKHERRTDPLLSYIHHARNADEHGIKAVTKRNEGGWTIKGGGFFKVEGVIRTGKREIKVTPVRGPAPTVEVVQPYVELVSVTDERFGDTFDVPKAHLGAPLTLKDQSPQKIAALALAYLEQLVAEASRLAR